MRLHTLARLTLLLLVLVAALMLTACGSSDSATTDGDTAAPTEQAPTQDTGDGGAASSTPTGEELVQQKCTTCHSLEQATSRRADAAGWAATVDQMVSRGLQVTDEEKAAIVDYLAANYGQ